MEREWIEWAQTGVGALVFGVWAYLLGYTKAKADA